MFAHVVKGLLANQSGSSCGSIVGGLPQLDGFPSEQLLGSPSNKECSGNLSDDCVSLMSIDEDCCCDVSDCLFVWLLG